MSRTNIKRALISVHDKTGVVEFARALHSEFGVELISTGGTARLLREQGIPVTLIEEVTGFPEMLDGRVKTLHPAIHAAILADRGNPDHMSQLAAAGIKPIDLVAVNLYPFAQTVADPACTFEQAVEMIDIGGVTLLRAAAKNHGYVLPVSSPEQYTRVLEFLRGTSTDSYVTDGGHLAAMAFGCTCAYDAYIRDYILSIRFNLPPGEVHRRFPPLLWDFFEKRGQARYGENPHQLGAYYRRSNSHGTRFASRMAKVEPSYNNYLDADAAFQLCADLVRARAEQYAAVFIKHTNPCGVGVGDDPVEACRRAYLGDPQAAMGGVLACGFEVTPAVAEAIMGALDNWGRQAGAGAFFLEVWLASAFTEEARQLIRVRKNWGERVRIVPVADFTEPFDPDLLLYRSVIGGVLIQTPDTLALDEKDWSLASARHPTVQELADLRLAWLVAKYTRSNAISICRNGMLLGNGAGQMSRVMSCRLATWLATENGHAEALRGAAAASDGFFPFRDGPDLLLEAGVTALIQPGGSKRDAEVIAACDERGAALILTGQRHFRH